MVSYNPSDPDGPTEEDRLIRDTPRPSRIPESDPVKHPRHYDGPPCPECGTPIETRVLVEEMPYFRGAAVKYLMRAGKKDRDKMAFFIRTWNNWLQGSVVTKLQRPNDMRWTAANFPRPMQG